jgi:hypothetical protein
MLCQPSKIGVHVEQAADLFGVETGGEKPASGLFFVQLLCGYDS